VEIIETVMMMMMMMMIIIIIIMTTLWSNILLYKLIFSQLVKIPSALYGFNRFITVFTRARHWIVTERWIFWYYPKP